MRTDESDMEVRPWRRSDLALLRAAASSFSPRTLSARFMIGTTSLPTAYLDRLLGAGRDGLPWLGEVALSGGELIGIAECAWEPGHPVEFALLVADAWHRHGVGARLTGSLLKRCVQAGITDLWAQSDLGNTAAVRLARSTRWRSTPVGDWAVSTSLREGVRWYTATFAFPGRSAAAPTSNGPSGCLIESAGGAVNLSS
ncbi:GNAT family N-acetyltransferase [Actinoplanes sp. NPDC049596]|uniref:GNAT family N-acetyltransferase n=1 Tax=unclassified Actinoplanes TaxID=2626549 RepID=UPI0034323AF4